MVRLLNNKNFEPGPFYFGKVGLIIGYIGVAWVLVITVSLLHLQALLPIHAPKSLCAEEVDLQNIGTDDAQDSILWMNPESCAEMHALMLIFCKVDFVQCIEKKTMALYQ